MAELRRAYVTVELKDRCSFGGNQEWFSDPRVQNLGCGLIASVDLMIYLEAESGKLCQLERQEYMELTGDMRRKYFHLWPWLGLTGWQIARGMNRMFRGRKNGWHAHWGSPISELGAQITRMLDEDLPVILSVGPNWPRLWGDAGVTLYRKLGDVRKPEQIFRDHYVVVTAYDGKVLTVSSWGRRYDMMFEEYCEYIRQFSNTLFSNILVIKKRG